MKSEQPSNGAVLIATYDGLDRYVQAFAGGSFNLIVLVGAPGLQKSRVVRDALPNACWIEGHATPLGIYMRLWDHRDEPVVIDEVDSLYADKAAVRLLKSLCQTERRKTVSWESSTKILKDANIPTRFTTSSQVIIIANVWKTLNAHVTALEDRGHLLHFDPTALEVHARVAGWFWDQEIFDWIGEHLHLVERPTMRLYRAAWELKESSMDWRGQLLGRWLSGTRLLVARLRADTSFASEEDRARAFVEQGGGSRATYFNHARKLRTPTGVPKIVLTNSVAPSDEPLDLMEMLRQRHGGLGRG